MLYNFSAKGLKTCIKCIARFENLKELTLSFNELKTKQPIDDCLSLIGQKCTKLLKLDLSIFSEVPISKRFFTLFSEYKAIKKLNIHLKYDIEVKGSVEAFKHCKQLKHLDITYGKLTEDFFANIASFVPKLQFLRIISRNTFSDSFIDLFQSMKNIQNVYLLVNQNIFPKKYWYFGKSLSEVMLSLNGKYIIPIDNNCGLLSDLDF